MKIGILQPYFAPYIGYFQLMKHCDCLVLFDDVQYTKNSWITRNRIQNRGKVVNISLSVRHSPSNSLIVDKQLASSFDGNQILRQLDDAYRKAKFYGDARNIIGSFLHFKTSSLFDYLSNSILVICQYLEIETNIVRSSATEVSKCHRGENRVIEICRTLGATRYINPIGGTSLYSLERFKESNLELVFLKSRLSPYSQGLPDFIPSLSIIDLMANCSREQLREAIEGDFDLVSP